MSYKFLNSAKFELNKVTTDNKLFTKYELIEKKAMQQMAKQDELKKQGKVREYAKFKIDDPKVSLNYWKGAIKELIRFKDLLGHPRNEINTQYLTNEGWVTNNEYSRDLNVILADPITDRGLASGLFNNALEGKVIYGVSLEVFKKPSPRH